MPETTHITPARRAASPETTTSNDRLIAMNSPTNDRNKITDFGIDDDIDVPVYRREAKSAEDPAARHIDAPKGNDNGDIAPTEKPQATADKPAASNPTSDGSGRSESAAVPKRDIYAALGRARPQRIEPAKPAAAHTATSEAPTEAAARDDVTFQGDAEESNLTSNGADEATAVFAAASTAPSEKPPFDLEDTSTSVFPVAPSIASDDGENPSARNTINTDAAEDSGNPYTATEVKEETSRGTEDVKEKRGTLSFGLLLLRVTLGGLLLAHGLQHLFALGGAPDVETLGDNLAIYKFSDWIAFGIPVTQVVAGGLLILGLLTPLGAAFGAIVSGFLALHNLAAESTSLWPESLNPQVHVWGLYALVALVLIFTGPGGISLDRNRGFVRRPLASSWIFAILSLGGIVGVWIAAGGGNPLG